MISLTDAKEMNKTISKKISAERKQRRKDNPSPNIEELLSKESVFYKFTKVEEILRKDYSLPEVFNYSLFIKEKKQRFHKVWNASTYFVLLLTTVLVGIVAYNNLIGIPEGPYEIPIALFTIFITLLLYGSLMIYILGYLVMFKYKLLTDICDSILTPNKSADSSNKGFKIL